MSCQTCGCSPCNCVPCPPSILNQPRIFNPVVSGGLFTNGIWQSPTIAAPTINGGAINGATIDCTTTVCTQPLATCDATVASTAFVCAAINDAVSALNPAFCTAVDSCVTGGGLCVAVASCINTTPDIITNPLAFAASTLATTTQRGVVEIAEVVEIENNVCGVAIDPCGLITALATVTPISQFGFALQTAIGNLLPTTPGICAAVFSCGAAPLASPIFTGDPQAPTPAPGDNDTSIATTAFVTAASALLAPLASPVFTGDPQAPTPALADNDNSIATTAFVQGEITAMLAPSLAFCAAVNTCVAGFAPVNNPIFTGDPQAPTPALGDNDTSIATTAFVNTAIADVIDPIFFSSVTAANLAATETDAFSHAIAANLLAANGDAIEFEASGSIAATVSVDKRIRVYFGTAIVFDSGLLAITTAQSWHLRGSLVRTGVNAQKIATTLTTSDGTTQAIARYAAAAENTAVAQAMKLTLNGNLANDVIAEFYRDRFVSV